MHISFILFIKRKENTFRFVVHFTRAVKLSSERLQKVEQRIKEVFSYTLYDLDVKGVRLVPVGSLFSLFYILQTKNSPLPL